MTIETWLAFVAASTVLLLIPGPTVLLVVSYALGQGWRTALPMAAGVALGDFTAMTLSMLGVGALLATSATLFTGLKWVGAAYLVWLGIKLIRSPVEGLSVDEKPAPPRGGFFLQGFLVLLSNPKVLVFFGAFIPQFMDMSQPHFPQVALLGITFMVTAVMTDAVYAVLAGRARLFFSARRTRLVSRISGGFMIGGGIWLALTRAR